MKRPSGKEILHEVEVGHRHPVAPARHRCCCTLLRPESKKYKISTKVQ